VAHFYYYRSGSKKILTETAVQDDPSLRGICTAGEEDLQGKSEGVADDGKADIGESEATD
jgi:hypothetical protein